MGKYRVVLTEKYSVARDLAFEFSQKFKTRYKETDEGFFLNRPENLVITYASGHLFEIDDSILPRRWILEDLPLFPEKFRYRFRDERAEKRFRLIKKVLALADELYLALDPGREGENIGRLILIHANWKNWDRTYRIWTSRALTADVLLEEMAKKVSVREFDSLFFSAVARQHADFLVGINFTRAVTLIFSFTEKMFSNNGREPQSKVWSVGRVQTPTLRLVVERDRIIESFKKVKYYVIKAVFEKLDGFRYSGVLRKSDVKNAKGGDVLPGFSKDEAEAILNELRNERAGIILDVDRSERRENPPELFSLTTLQRFAGSVLKISAEKVHQIAQSLYQDHKVISYPRTEATGLPDNMIPFVKKLLSDFGFPELAERASSSYRHVFNPAKLTDHHAIIPLKANPSLPEGSLEKKLFEIIKNRFIAAFMDPYRYYSITVKTKLGRYVFTSRFRQVIDPGWKKIFTLEERENNNQKDRDEEIFDVQDELLFRKYEGVFCMDLNKEEKETKPPARYTDGSLIAEMKRLGLGTPATRDSIIETLITRGYLKREKGSLISTDKGRRLIDFLIKREIASPEMTSQWEEKLEKIYTDRKGRSGYEEFISGIKDFVRKEIVTFVNNFKDKTHHKRSNFQL